MRDGEGEAWDDEEGETAPVRPSRGPASPARRRRRRSPDVAAVLAILVPGLGHLYVGRLRAAGIWLIVVLLGYWAILLPGVVLHVLSIVSARRAASADGEA
jgi:hypothetical protein